MQISPELREDIVRQLRSKWKDVPRAALESLALEAYRFPALTAAQLRRLLGFQTRWSRKVPVWVEVLRPKSSLSLKHLDQGESEAIALAAEIYADVALMDEQAGRQEAARKRLEGRGHASVLDEAEQAGLINFYEAVAELQETSRNPSGDRSLRSRLSGASVVAR